MQSEAFQTPFGITGTSFRQSEAFQTEFGRNAQPLVVHAKQRMLCVALQSKLRLDAKQSLASKACKTNGMTKQIERYPTLFIVNRVTLSMSLATSIKDFSDTLNNLYTVKNTSLPILPFLQEIILFTLKSIISGVVYILTFEWFRDVSYLPLLNPALPQQLEITNAERFLFPGFAGSSFGDSFFADPASHLFQFSSLPKSSTDYILSGLVNSFFFSLPFSLPHLISIRRLFSQGVQAALASLVGSIVAHSLFLFSLFYGLRFLIIPWFSLEPVTYILGFAVNVVVIKELIQASPQRFQRSGYAIQIPFSANTSINTHPNRMARKQLSIRQLFSDVEREFSVFSPPLLRISFLSFLLTWCEEVNVFSSISNLTFNAQNTYLDLYPSANASTSLLVHTAYVLAFIVGNCAFSFVFYFLLFQSGPLIASWTNLSSTKIHDTINKLVMLFILTLTFASFPYYGLDYLFGKVGGFLPEDPVYRETVLSPTKITVNKRNTIFVKAESADKKKHTGLLDINNFDNGVYLNNIDFNKFDNFPSDSKSSISRTTSFEKSNYRQENAWIRRNYLAKLRARPRKNSDTTGTTSFYKTFKDPKAYYQRIQLESDRKQSRNVREKQAKKPYGSSVRRQEGVLAEELVSVRQDFWDRFSGVPEDGVLQAVEKRMSVDQRKRQVDATSKLSFRGNQALLGRTDHADSLPSNTHDLADSSQKDDTLDPETNIFAERYTKGVKQKSIVPPLKKTKSLSTKNIIKRRFFLNPVYRTLLQTDIDAFMARQPAVHNIAENQDYDLYKKRTVLERYYNWLRRYSPLQKDLQSLYNVPQTRSFVDSVFHHQFKGTLKIAKRLFPVSFDRQQNSKRDRVLSYDQTLYKDLPISENPLMHEELGKEKENFSSVNERLRSGEPYRFDNSPFVEESDTSPLYAGWDNTSRRFVITNQFFVEKE